LGGAIHVVSTTPRNNETAAARFDTLPVVRALPWAASGNTDKLKFVGHFLRRR
jgi:hypothetical protein